MEGSGSGSGAGIVDNAMPADWTRLGLGLSHRTYHRFLMNDMQNEWLPVSPPGVSVVAAGFGKNLKLFLSCLLDDTANVLR